MNNKIPESLENIFILNNNIHRYNTRIRNEPHAFATKSNLFNQSFIIRAPKFWRELLENHKQSNNIGLFTKRVKKHLITNM